jgi:hypothetical protein
VCSRRVIIEFLVDDVDGVRQNLADFVEDFVSELTAMAWGNRSLLFRDPTGTSSTSSPLHPGRHREVRPLTTPRPIRSGSAMQLERIVVVVRLVAACQDACQGRTSAFAEFRAIEQREECLRRAFQVIEDRHLGCRLPSSTSGSTSSSKAALRRR